MARRKVDLSSLTPDERALIDSLRRLPRSVQMLLVGAFTLSEEAGPAVACAWLARVQALLESSRAPEGRVH
jgi:hypothetical protein